jgi:hypothetical protein
MKKIFYKIGASIALISLILVMISMPISPIAEIGIAIFGSYEAYLGTLLSTFGLSAIIILITFIWNEI